MKLRNIGFPFFDLNTGYLQVGTYKSDAIIKIAELCRTNKGIIPQLLPTYYKNDTIVLKRKNNIVGYRVIYYGSLTVFNEENYKLINKHCHSISKTEALKFLTNHSKEIAEVFKEEKAYNKYMLRLIFELGKLPYEFEMTYKGELITDFTSAKEMWKIDKNNFELITYKK